MKYRLLLVLLTMALFCSAQKETAAWFLSHSRVSVTPAGISNVTPNGISPLFQPQTGSTSISDSAGNLLFAVCDRSIINKNLVLMPALANTQLSSADKILIAPVPGSQRYYVFYTSPNSWMRNASWTLRYAVVDLSLQGGNGDVVSYNNVVDTALSRGFTLAQAANGTDTWLVTHRKEGTTFLSYKISATGLSTVPVASNAGTLPILIDYIFRELKTSNNGKLIAGITYRDYTNIFAMTWGALEVFNFDALTGQLTSRVRTSRGSGYFTTFHSLQFSPDDRLLYASYNSRIIGLQPCDFASSHLVQYNLCYTDTAEFMRYSMYIGSRYSRCNTASWGTIQLGADKKIYLPFTGVDLSAVHYPNRVGTSSGLQFNAHQTLTGTNGVAPSFYHAETVKAVKNNITYSGGCYPAPISFRITNDTIINVQWNFGDPASGANTSSSVTPQHVFSAPGTYTVTAQLYNSAGSLIETLSELVEIKNPAQRLLAAYPVDTSFCQGGTLKLKLNVVNGVFHWRNKSPFNGTVYSMQTSDSLDISYSGKYYVEMRQNDCNGCTMIDSINVTVLPTPYLNLGLDRTLCTGDSIQLVGNDPAAHYRWSTGDTTRSIWVRTGGVYWVQAELDSNGCPIRDSIVITLLPGVQFALPPDTTLCNNQTLTLSPGVSNASYLWQNGSTQATFTVTQPGRYWVRVTAANDCRKSDTIQVGYVNAQAVSLGQDTALCVGGTLTLSANIPNAQYLWSNGATTPAITITQGGSYWLRVISSGCTAADTINAVFNPLPTFSLGADTTICQGQRLKLFSGITGVTNQWSTGSANDTLVVSSPGLYWLTITKNGCTWRDSILVSYKPSPVVSLGTDTAICSGSNLLLSAAQPAVQQWGWQDGSTQPNYLVTAPGTYWVKLWSINGCSSSDTINVSGRALPVFSLGIDTILCEGRQLSYNFNLPGASYLWNTASTTANAQFTQPGLYWLEVMQNGCRKRDSVRLDVKPLPIVDLGRDTTVCENAIFELRATTPGASYGWSTGATDEQIRVAQPGLYWLRVNLRGCVAADSVQVGFRYLPKFTLGRDTLLCNGQSFTLSPQAGGGQYLWNDGSIAATYTVTQPGTYALTVTNSCGNASDALVVGNGVCALYMPTAFTPNNDGLNDDFRVKHPQFIKTFAMQVFNRWGERVYYTTNPYDGWDGRTNGSPQATGAYVWMITLTDLNGKQGMYKGTVMVVR